MTSLLNHHPQILFCGPLTRRKEQIKSRDLWKNRSKNAIKHHRQIRVSYKMLNQRIWLRWARDRSANKWESSRLPRRVKTSMSHTTTKWRAHPSSKNRRQSTLTTSITSTATNQVQLLTEKRAQQHQSSRKNWLSSTNRRLQIQKSVQT